ncbi:MAG: hypothetical protein SGPRY_011410, partial [Prymnesium sp.]
MDIPYGETLAPSVTQPKRVVNCWEIKALINCTELTADTRGLNGSLRFSNNRIPAGPCTAGFWSAGAPLPRGRFPRPAGVSIKRLTPLDVLRVEHQVVGIGQDQEPSACSWGLAVGDGIGWMRLPVRGTRAARSLPTPHPLEGDEHDFPADVRRAARAAADHIARKEELGAERRRILKIIKRIKEDLRPVNARLRKVAPSYVKNAPQQIDAALLHACACAVGVPDGDLAASFVVGFPPVGDIPVSGWWGEELDLASRDLMLEDHDQWVRYLERQLHARTWLQVKSSLLIMTCPAWLISLGLRWRKDVQPGLFPVPNQIEPMAEDAGGPCSASAYGRRANYAPKMRCERADFPARVARHFSDEFDARGLKLRALKAGTGSDGSKHVVKYFTMAGLSFG